jgi:hypothetical protein
VVNKDAFSGSSRARYKGHRWTAGGRRYGAAGKSHRPGGYDGNAAHAIVGYLPVVELIELHGVMIGKQKTESNNKVIVFQNNFNLRKTLQLFRINCAQTLKLWLRIQKLVVTIIQCLEVFFSAESHP